MVFGGGGEQIGQRSRGTKVDVWHDIDRGKSIILEKEFTIVVVMGCLSTAS